MRALYALGLALSTSLVPEAPRAETISEALARAYLSNPMLNRDRAATRAADESVAKAKAGYRPRVEIESDLGYDRRDIDTRRGFSASRSGDLASRVGTATVTETLFDGNRTTNRVQHAESQDLASREALRRSEQETLLAGATAYMDVLRDTALEDLARNEIRVLEYELRGSRARYRAKEITYTDVAQVASRLAASRTRFFRAQATLETSIATYRRIIGTPPARLEAARPVDAVAPATQVGAITLALTEHPSIAEALHDVDAAMTTVKVQEGEFYPTVDLVGRGRLAEQVRRTTDDYSQLSARARIAVPIYDGKTYAAVRQARERVSEAQFKAESARQQVRASVSSAWGQLAAAKALIASSMAAVKASESALVDVRAEASMGQRTTYDVLLAIQALFAARTTLVAAQRDRVVDSYELAAATGRLNASNLGLAVTPYDPTIHFAQVKDKWSGLRTPDGR